MNSKLEVCINCPVQCKLDNISGKIVFDSKNGEIDLPTVKQRIQVLSQQVNITPGCPRSEIRRMGTRIYEELGRPGILQTIGHRIILSTASEKTIRPDSNVRRETYTQYRYRKKHFG
jgi:hypothetical protein